MEKNYSSSNNISTESWWKPGSECYMFASEQMINNNLSADETERMLVERGMNPADAHELVCKIEEELKMVNECQQGTIPNESSAITNEDGTATTPQCLKKWNMGAFMFSWLWGCFNRVWWPIVAMIVIAFVVVLLKPISSLPRLLVLILGIILGIEGNRMSWEQYKTDSGDIVERFDRRQKRWNMAGWIAFAINIVAILVYVIGI